VSESWCRIKFGVMFHLEEPGNNIMMNENHAGSWCLHYLSNNHFRESGQPEKKV